MKVRLTTEPIWVPQMAVIAAHFDQLQEHGGAYGLRERGALLEAALARPRNKFAYEELVDLADLAAAYAFGIAKASHPFNDGNKRTGFVVAVIFLILNGKTINHPEASATQAMRAVADGSMSEEQLAEWLRAGLVDAPATS